MFDKIVALYCITDDLLKTIDHHDDQRRALSDAEVMTTAYLDEAVGPDAKDAVEIAIVSALESG